MLTTMLPAGSLFAPVLHLYLKIQDQKSLQIMYLLSLSSNPERNLATTYPANLSSTDISFASMTNELTIRSVYASVPQPKWKPGESWILQTENDTKATFDANVVGGFSCHGVNWEKEAKINQDRGGIAFPYGSCPRTALFAVYDGHGKSGEEISKYAMENIPRLLEDHPTFPDQPQTALHEVFVKVDQNLKNECHIDSHSAGTTACVVLLQNDTLTVANAGDSRALCGRKLSDGDFMAVELTVDQKPDDGKEKMRIEAAGGYVKIPTKPGKPPRVYSGKGSHGLAVSRSIGDHDVGAVGVIPDPIVTRHVVGPDDEFLVVFSDGVGNAIKSKEIVSIVGDKLREGATAASRVLIQEAAERWKRAGIAKRDDITVIVVVLSNLWGKEAVSRAAPSEKNKENVSSTAPVTEFQKLPKHLDDSVSESLGSCPLTRSKATLPPGPLTRSNTNSHCSTN